MRLPKKEGLNIVPFIDIMLVLLAIILSTASFVAQGQIKVNIPESSSAMLNQEQKKIQITINEMNEFFIDGRSVPKTALKDEIMNIDNKMQIELIADNQANFASFIEILDILKAKNHENFTIKAKMKG